MKLSVYSIKERKTMTYQSGTSMALVQSRSVNDVVGNGGQRASRESAEGSSDREKIVQFRSLLASDGIKLPSKIDDSLLRQFHVI